MVYVFRTPPSDPKVGVSSTLLNGNTRVYEKHIPSTTQPA